MQLLLMVAMAAAVVWTHDLGVQAIIDETFVALQEGRIDTCRVACELEGRIDQILGFDHVIDETPLQGGLRIDKVASERQLLCSANPDHARKLLR